MMTTRSRARLLALLVMGLVYFTVSSAFAANTASKESAGQQAQIKKCDKRFSGKTKKRHEAKQRCIKAAKKASKHKGTNGGGSPGAGEPSPGSTAGPTPAQGPGTSALALTTTELHAGVAGLAYLEQLSATGGVAPYSYAITDLPAGLSGDNSGLITGSPEGTGTAEVDVEVTDAEGMHVHAALELAVPTTMPADCMQQSCSHLTADGDTVQIDGSKVTAVTRDPQTKEVTGLSLTGPAPTPQQIIVVSPTEALPSGLTALVLSTTPGGNEETNLTLEQATLGDAYASGTVQAIGSTPPAEGSHAAATSLRHRAASTSIQTAPSTRTLGGASLTCGSGVSSDLRGLNVQPSLTPSMAAIWHHPLFGGGGFYPGTGGLELFQFDLDGDIQLNIGVSISGKATCTLQLPSLIATIPAGDLGAVVIETTPTLTLKADGKVDTRASITLSCGAEYRWDQGSEYRGSYCAHSYQPLHLAADTGVNVTASGALETAVSLDDVVGVDGTITAGLHAGYTPTLQPVAELDTSVEYELGACLVCFWKGSPTRVTIAHGVRYHKTIATYDSTPSPPTDNSVEVEGLDFGALPAGQESVEHLTASGGAEPYSFAVSPDPTNLAKVPGWVNLEPDGTVRIDPPSDTEQSVSFYVYATDATGERTPLEREQVQFSVTAGVPVTGMSWSAIEAPVPDGGLAGSGQLYGDSVACSTNSCFAGGFYEKDGAGYNMIDTLAGGVWTAIDVPVPPGGDPGTGSIFSTVCPPTGPCTAAGSYSDSGQYRYMIDTLTNGVWNAIEIPMPPGGEPGSAFSEESPVCSSADICVLTGRYQNSGGHERHMIDTLDHGTWTSTEFPVPPGGEPGSGYSDGPTPLACSASGICVLGGQYDGPGSVTTSMIDTYEGGDWSAIQTPVPPGAQVGPGGIAFNEPTCTSSGTCVLSAWSWLGDHYQGMIDTFVDGTWATSEVPVPSGVTPGSGLVLAGGGSCPSAATCLLTGQYEEITARGMIVTFSGGTWAATEVPVPPGAVARTGNAFDLSCASAALCVADGFFDPAPVGSALPSFMLVTLTNGTWNAIAAPVPAGGLAGRNPYFTDLSGPTCTSAGICVTTGSYHDTEGNKRGLIDSFLGGIWTAVQAPVPTGGEAGTGSVFEAACMPSGTCAIAGAFGKSGGGQQGMIVVGEPQS